MHSADTFMETENVKGGKIFNIINSVQGACDASSGISERGAWITIVAIIQVRFGLESNLRVTSQWRGFETLGLGELAQEKMTSNTNSQPAVEMFRGEREIKTFPRQTERQWPKCQEKCGEIMASHKPQKVFMFPMGEVLSLDYVNGRMTDSYIKSVNGHFPRFLEVLCQKGNITWIILSSFGQQITLKRK